MGKNWVPGGNVLGRSSACIPSTCTYTSCQSRRQASSEEGYVHVESGASTIWTAKQPGLFLSRISARKLGAPRLLFPVMIHQKSGRRPLQITFMEMEFLHGLQLDVTGGELSPDCFKQWSLKSTHRHKTRQVCTTAPVPRNGFRLQFCSGTRVTVVQCEGIMTPLSNLLMYAR